MSLFYCKHDISNAKHAQVFAEIETLKVVLSLSVEETAAAVGKIAYSHKEGINMDWITREPTQVSDVTIMW